MKLRFARRYAVVVAVPFAVLSPLDAQALQFSESLQSDAPITLTAELTEATQTDLVDNVAAPALALSLSETLPSPATASRIARVLRSAFGMVGTAYRLGRDSFDAVDCSAMVRRAFGSAGEELPRTAKEMLASGEAIDNHEDIQAGDLLFYRWQRRQLHVAVYVDDNTIVHASPAAGRVVVTQLSPDWQRHLVAVRRVL